MAGIQLWCYHTSTVLYSPTSLALTLCVTSECQCSICGFKTAVQSALWHEWGTGILLLLPTHHAGNGQVLV